MTERRPFTKAQRLEVFEAFGAIVCCQGRGCDSAIYIRGCHIDHTRALIDDGEHNLTNWRPLCISCHAKKSAREHKLNSKAKRLAAARQAHDAAVKREAEKKRGAIKSRGFDKKLRKRFDGKVVERV